MQAEVERRLARLRDWCHRHNLATVVYQDYGTDTVDRLDGLAARALADYPNTVFFSAKLVFDQENLFTRLLHNETPLALQRLLHLRGAPMVILPMRV